MSQPADRSVGNSASEAGASQGTSYLFNANANTSLNQRMNLYRNTVVVDRKDVEQLAMLSAALDNSND